MISRRLIPRTRFHLTSLIPKPYFCLSASKLGIRMASVPTGSGEPPSGSSYNPRYIDVSLGPACSIRSCNI